MITCPTCGEHNPERARFCVACGTPPVTARVAIGDVEAAAEPVRRTPEPNARRLRLSVATAESVVAAAEGLLEGAPTP